MAVAVAIPAPASAAVEEAAAEPEVGLGEEALSKMAPAVFPAVAVEEAALQPVEPAALAALAGAEVLANMAAEAAEAMHTQVPLAESPTIPEEAKMAEDLVPRRTVDVVEAVPFITVPLST